MHITNKLLILFTTFVLFNQLFAKTTEKKALELPLTDGPYIFQINGKSMVCSLIDGNLNIKEYKKGQPFEVKIPSVEGLSVKISDKKPSIDSDIFENVNTWFAISDVHGQFNRMKDILIANHIIDNSFNWTFGKKHFVFVGDAFDRGPMVTECLWLLYKMDQQAKKAGGQVHILLGNHESMVFENDLRYVNERYKTISKKIKRIRYPDLFSENTVLGKWLRTKQGIIKINDTLFVHAGIHPHFVKNKFSIADINLNLRKFLGKKSHIIAFDPEASFLFGRNGIFWSRGFFSMEGYEPISKEELEKILVYYKASKVVVGHTRFDHVLSHLDGFVLTTAVNTEDDFPAEGLFFKKGKYFNADSKGKLTEILLK